MTRLSATSHRCIGPGAGRSGQCTGLPSDRRATACRWVLPALLFLLGVSGRAQEITTSYTYDHCHNDSACAYEDWDTSDAKEAKTIEPDGSYTITYFNLSAQDIQDKKYDSGDTVLQTTDTTWTTGGRSAVKTYGSSSSSYWSKTTYQYDSAGNISQQDVDSTISIGLPFKGRRTTRSWVQISGTLMQRLEEEIVYDVDTSSNTTLVSKTHYNYDEFSLTNRTGTIAGHDSSYGTSYTSRGNVTTVRRWLSAGSGSWIDSKSYYDILGNVVQTTDPLNHSTTVTYSSSNNLHYAYPTQVTNAKSQSVSTTYSSYTGQVASVTDANSQTTSTTYDSLNRVTRIDSPDGGYVRAAYDLTANNFATTVYRSIATGREAASTTYIDGIGREKQKRTRSPEGDSYVDTQYYACDCNGKVAKVSNPYRAGQTKYWTETQFDQIGRPSKIIPPDGTSSTNRTLYSYDMPAGSTTVTDPAGKVKKYEYDAIGRIWRVTEPNSSGSLTLTTTYDYLPTQGTNKLVITQGDQTRTFIYDTLGRLTSETHPENGTTTYTYDDTGNVSTKTDARNFVTTYSYDEINRLTGKTYSGDSGVTPSVTLNYDSGTYGVGKLTSWSVGSSSSSGSTTYDIMGRPSSESRTLSGTTHSASWSYNLGGQVVTTTYPNSTGTVTSTFDAVGALEAISSSFAGSVVSNVDRNAAGAWTTVNYANGVTNSRSFASSTLQLSGLQITGPSGTYLDYSYGYNSGSANNGRIASITDNQDSNKTVSYTYDELNRLATAATTGSAWGLSWTYDRYGNRTAQSVTKGSGVPSNSLTVSTSTNRVSGWTYDSSGNVTNDGRNTYTYDAENRVLSSNNGSATTTYTYDAFGGRVTKTTGSTTTRYYFGLGEYSGSSWKLFVGTAAGVVEYETGTTTITYKSNDHLGSPRVMTGSAGTITARTDLYPYGEVWSETSGGTKYKMTGKERDSESGNDFFGERYYYNGAGRWLAFDPAAGNIYDPQQLNRYVYCLDDPINFIDRGGEQVEIPEGQPGSETNPFPITGPRVWGTAPSPSPSSEPSPEHPRFGGDIRSHGRGMNLGNTHLEKAGAPPWSFYQIGKCLNSLLSVYDTLPLVPGGAVADVVAFVGTNLQNWAEGTWNNEQFGLSLANLITGLGGRGIGKALEEDGLWKELGPALAALPEMALYESAAEEAGYSTNFTFPDITQQGANPLAILGGLVGGLVGQVAPAFGNQILDNCNF